MRWLQDNISRRAVIAFLQPARTANERLVAEQLIDAVDCRCWLDVRCVRSLFARTRSRRNQVLLSRPTPQTQSKRAYTTMHSQRLPADRHRSGIKQRELTLNNTASRLPPSLFIAQPSSVLLPLRPVCRLRSPTVWVSRPGVRLPGTQNVP